jgi:hypothetical protein
MSSARPIRRNGTPGSRMARSIATMIFPPGISETLTSSMRRLTARKVTNPRSTMRNFANADGRLSARTDSAGFRHGGGKVSQMSSLEQSYGALKTRASVEDIGSEVQVAKKFGPRCLAGPADPKPFRAILEMAGNRTVRPCTCPSANDARMGRVSNGAPPSLSARTMWLVYENIRMAAEAQGYTVAAVPESPGEGPRRSWSNCSRQRSEIGQGTLTDAPYPPRSRKCSTTATSCACFPSLHTAPPRTCCSTSAASISRSSNPMSLNFPYATEDAAARGPDPLHHSTTLGLYRNSPALLTRLRIPPCPSSGLGLQIGEPRMTSG